MARPPLDVSPELKQEALDLYVEYGPSESSRRTGINKQTIAAWAYRIGLQTHALDTVREARELSAQQAGLLREELKQRLAIAALGISKRLEESYTDVIGVPHHGQPVSYTTLKPPGHATKALASALADIIKTLRLEEGEATSRSELSIWDRGVDLDAELTAFVAGSASALQQPEPTGQSADQSYAAGQSYSHNGTEVLDGHSTT